MPDLTSLLHSTFGFSTFRANQEAVCRATTAGRDVLLVMPTGAGKSLCYQLPAIARGGTALVVSPLIALMDDQAAKLAGAELKVARIHSGLSRDDARQACRDYLDGTLNFLFIAPERMRVPGFPEMLARRKPSLIAIDEAHCISAWGHDFRPDYRSLGEHLPALRPAPIIALTATATPTVQKDIVAQLHLADPALFIHGFRRSNLAIEVVEMSKPRRHEFTTTLLKNPSARPAIVYAPSRRSAEELAAELARHFPAAAYHAGLESSVRERVQQAFQSGKLEVVVATIAFGMGIDKADVRTVVHTALPSSVEAFYQEIGRAGRDGLPSRTVLLYSFVDRKIHETFLERDYPPPTELSRVASVLTTDFLMPEPLWRKLKMTPDIFTKSIEKLASQGAAQLDMAGNVRGTGVSNWRSGYEAQVAFRQGQIDRMMQFAESRQCRMTAIIQHFGDTADATRACGICDVCNPQAATAQSFHPPDAEEFRQLAAVLRALEGQSRSTGKLHAELATGALRGTAAAKDRKAFDVLLDALARAALITLIADTFTNSEGNVITYRKAALTHEGREATAGESLHPYELLIKDVAESSSPHPTSKSAKTSAPRPSKASLKAERDQTTALYTPSQRDLEARMRAWRKTEAAKTGKPAFMIFADSVLHAIVLAGPTTISALLAISGVGPRIADNYGAEIIALCRAASSNEPAPQPPPKNSSFRPERSEVEEPPHSFRSATSPQESPAEFKKRQKRIAEGFKPQGSHAKQPHERTAVDDIEVRQPSTPFHRTRTAASDPTADLTEDQQLLDLQLRAWRKSESERIGLPQFFVLGSSTLRSIVLLRPKTVAQLQSIAGIGPDKSEKFGASIITICNQ